MCQTNQKQISTYDHLFTYLLGLIPNGTTSINLLNTVYYILLKVLDICFGSFNNHEQVLMSISTDQQLSHTSLGSYTDEKHVPVSMAQCMLLLHTFPGCWSDWSKFSVIMVQYVLLRQTSYWSCRIRFGIDSYEVMFIDKLYP